MQNTFSCMIVDDNEVARLKAVSFVSQYPFLRVAGVFDNAEAALIAARQQLPDVLFLDIDMPGISGLELRGQLPEVPACLFITSYPDYAVEGFEQNALDFLVKPLQADRFALAMRRLQDYLTLRQMASQLEGPAQDDSFFIRDGYDKVKIRLQEVIYLEALKDYTSIVTADKKHCVLSLLGNLLKEKPFDTFVRIHKSYAVQKKYISKVTASEVVVNGVKLPLGRTYKQTLADL